MLFGILPIVGLSLLILFLLSTLVTMHAFWNLEDPQAAGCRPGQLPQERRPHRRFPRSDVRSFGLGAGALRVGALCARKAVDSATREDSIMDYGHSLEFGTFITPPNPRPQEIVALAQLTERAGLELVTFQDHPTRRPTSTRGRC